MSEIEVLARRVRWLDRYRRPISIALAFVLGTWVTVKLSNVLGTEWPRAYVSLFSLACGVVAWWLIEVGLAWMTAVWETRCDRLQRDRGLPRAEMLQRRK